jgi:hypothetical protein
MTSKKKQEEVKVMKDNNTYVFGNVFEVEVEKENDKKEMVTDREMRCEVLDLNTEKCK